MVYNHSNISIVEQLNQMQMEFQTPRLLILFLLFKNFLQIYFVLYKAISAILNILKQNIKSC